MFIQIFATKIKISKIKFKNKDDFVQKFITYVNFFFANRCLLKNIRLNFI